MRRESVRKNKDSVSVRSNLMKAWKDSKSNQKRKGDWSPTVFREPNTKASKDFLWTLFSEFDVELIQSDRNKIFNKKPKDWDSFYHNDEENDISFGAIITNANKKG